MRGNVVSPTVTIAVTPGSDPEVVAWGSVADFLNVGVSLLVGVAVLLMSRQTNRLAKASNDTGFALREIEQERRRLELALHQSESRVLMFAMGQEISGVKAAAGALRGLLERNAKTYAASKAFRENVRDTLSNFSVNWYERHHSRLHVLPEDRASRLGLMYANIQTLKTIAANHARQDEVPVDRVAGLVGACNLISSLATTLLEDYEALLPEILSAPE